MSRAGTGYNSYAMHNWSLYVHIPYCQAKCPYCDFNSYGTQRWPEAAYVAALCAEFRHYVAEPPWADGRLHTVFFGGGTPSLFSPESIDTILHEIRRHPASEPSEITLEANPGTVTLEKLMGFRRAGVNRMSFGVQSFAAHHLRTLGRIHGADEAIAAVRLARQAGFGSVSIDLIFALPNQTLDEWECDLRQGSALEPDHISAYNLTYEEGTPFHQLRAQGTLRQLPEELEVAMFVRTQEILGTAGYRQYEISNFARPEYACQHNLNYWRSGQYLGVGAGAHSYALTIPPNGNAEHRPQTTDHGQQTQDSALRTQDSWGQRWSNEKNPNKYMEAVARAGHARSFCETLNERQARGEFVFLGLRCRDGFAANTFRERFGDAFPVLFPHARQLCDDGLLRCVDDRWELTERGLLLADGIFATFL